MLSGLIFAPFATEDIDEARIEELKDSDAIGEMLQEVAKQMPRVKTPLIDERDAYLMSAIQEAPGKKIVGVVGAAHVAGMVQLLGQSTDRAKLSEIPPPSPWTGALKFIIPAIMLGAFWFGYSEHGGSSLKEMLFAWILPNAVFAGLFSLLALAHPLTVLVAFLASPITSLNPTIGAGMVAALCEAWLRKPTVADCENVQDDISSLRSIYKNRFTHVLLVFVAASLGSAVGAWIGFGWVLSLL
ncbi:MAG: TraB/GumN family protein, partial [Polyangiaceae bacterium]|nr:TraB/GumN family protein [Polyangiaceae bacterium]